MSKFAEKTTVSSERSRAEIEKILSRYGATGFAYGWSGSDAVIAFEICARRIQFILHLPSRKEFERTPSRGQKRSSAQIETAYEQAVRQRWRSLCLTIKAKLVSAEQDIEMFEDAFMAQIMLPNGKTVGSMMRPQIESAYAGGEMPNLLPHLKD